jgi:hypothetical protein
MKKPRRKKPTPRTKASAVKVVKLSSTGKLQIVADKGVTPIVAILKENMIEVVPIRKSWWRQFIGY